MAVMSGLHHNSTILPALPSPMDHTPPVSLSPPLSDYPTLRLWTNTWIHQEPYTRIAVLQTLTQKMSKFSRNLKRSSAQYTCSFVFRHVRCCYSCFGRATFSCTNCFTLWNQSNAICLFFLKNRIQWIRMP